MKGRAEFVFYLATGAGMALACSSFMMLAGLFAVTTPFWIVVAIPLAALFCTAVAASIAELASMFPSAPAIRTYFKAAFGARTSLAVIYLYLIFVVLIAGVEANIFALVAKALVPGVPALVAVLAPLAGVTVTNLLGLELPRLAQIVLTFGAIAIILGAALIGIGTEPGRVAHALDPNGIGGLADLPAAMAIAVFLFVGFEWLTAVGIRASAYERKIPRALPLAVGALALAYAPFAVGLAGSLPRHEVADQLTPQIPFFEHILGTVGLVFAGLLSLSAIFSTFNAGMMGASRLLLAMSREGCVPRWCGTVIVTTSAPLGSVLGLSLAVGTTAVVVWGLGIQLAVSVVAAAMICVVYAGYMAAGLRLRRMAPDHPRSYRTPVPERLQAAIAVVFLAIGVATLFSLPGYGLWPLAGMAVAGVVAAWLAVLSARRAAAAAALRPPPRTRRRAAAPAAPLERARTGSGVS